MMTNDFVMHSKLCLVFGQGPLELKIFWKGTYERISKLKKQILVSVVDRLEYLLPAYSETCSAVKQLSKTFLKWASASLKRDKLCKF